jgi:hypothetical protein
MAAAAEVFPPPERVSTGSHVPSMAAYTAMYNRVRSGLLLVGSDGPARAHEAHGHL